MSSKLKSHKYYDIHDIRDHLKTIGWTKTEIELLEDILSPGCNGDLCYLGTDPEDDEDWEIDQCRIITKWRAAKLPKNPYIHYWW